MPYLAAFAAMWSVFLPTGKLPGTKRRPLASRLLARMLGSAALCMATPFAMHGQLCATSHTTDLYCLIPATFHTSTAPFNALFTPFGTELGELPIAKPAGTVLNFERGILRPSSESLGAVFSERAETLGYHRLFLGFGYQNFTFGRIDGMSLKTLPIVLYEPQQQVSTVTQSRFDIRVGQYSGLVAFGVTKRMDVSVLIPFERVSFAATVNGTEYGPTGASATFQEKVPGSSSGLSDVVAGGKYLVLDARDVRVSAGVDVRIPSGDELNFLGAGTVGVRPFVAMSRRGRLSPHVNVGYQWNGNSILNATTSGQSQQLPTDFFYSGGANIHVSRRWELVSDVVGRHFFSAPRLTQPAAIAVQGAGTVQAIGSTMSSYTTNDLNVGFKTAVTAHLTATGNITTSLDGSGLRARVVPLGAVSYSF